MKRSLVIAAFVALAHLLASMLIGVLAQQPVFANLYLGIFGLSSQAASVSTFILQPVFWCVATFHPQSFLHVSPAIRVLYPTLSSILYGVLAAAAFAGLRSIRHPRPAA